MYAGGQVNDFASEVSLSLLDAFYKGMILFIIVVRFNLE